MQYTDEWRAVAAATGPADRAAAEDAVRLAYRTAGLAEPGRFVWAGSPRAAVTAVRSLRDAGRSVRDEVRTVPWAEERRRVHDALGPAGWTELWGRTGALLWDTTRALAERIRAGVADALAADAVRAGDGPDAADAADAERKAVRMVLLDAVLGQHDAAWLAAFDGRSDRLAGLARVARHAGWWWPFEKAVVICERPVELYRDEAGRLDRGDGPALAFPDGFALHAWRGMPVTAEFLSGLASLTPERIRTEENAELRRVMLEFYGYDRYLAESGARPVHRDETGVLWCIALADDEDVTMVEVVNSTPEPDGTHKTYWLRVPPSTRTAKEGVAWTFGLDAGAYAPLRQT
ncbi:hypothetical protein SSP531S_37550 [Streptomyces spongiicola]|uniref:DUF6745 domain-containing protein n=1 Tax=Streptomyces spongiicola TaxID=1690221 RepID=A0A2S1Z7B9_9ACTN|nr:hypothetical protein [Streptomyces spongiicola]AWK12220.1 hypothetical protein DDQ41_28595 [Streptomyces spongiicola]GBQ02298.1 hypothetical protein SSP531S_37550 [Streptomyces spongiicola]